MDLLVGKLGILDSQCAVLADERMERILMSDDIFHIIVIMFGDQELYDDLGRLVGSSEMMMKPFRMLLVLEDGLLEFLDLLMVHIALIADIVVHQSHFEELMHDSEESAFSCAIRTYEHIHVIVFPIIKSDAFGLAEVGDIGETEEIGYLDIGELHTQIMSINTCMSAHNKYTQKAFFCKYQALYTLAKNYAGDQRDLSPYHDEGRARRALQEYPDGTIR